MFHCWHVFCSTSSINFCVHQTYLALLQVLQPEFMLEKLETQGDRALFRATSQLNQVAKM